MGAVLLVILVVGGLVLRNLFDQERFAHLRVTAGLKAREKLILEKYFKFYVALPPKSKKIFEHRVAKFISLKEYVPRQMPTVTDEMKVLIAASAIQLTFGFPRIFLSYFRYIIIFPDQFFSTVAQRYHKGEVNPGAKAIVLSWKHFVEGYALSEGINLGLHEMAHALQLENIIMNHEYDFMTDDAISNWQQLASKEIEKIRSNEKSLFREYGGTNHQEFFSVAVEYFFERPADFMSYDPDLYKAMANLLHQDPIRLYEKM